MEKAIIYVRGHNQEMQEVFCRLYAVDQGYDVMFVTTDIEDVKNCDVMLVKNGSRISRDKFKYYETINDLKKKGITVESATAVNNTEEMPWLTKDLMK